MAAKKIEIIYDVDGKAIDVAVDKTLNLQQAAKALTAELRRTKEGSDEFQLLSARLGDAQDGLKNVNAKSQDLFGSLSMLPGPIGMIGGTMSSTIETMKTFSSFTFKDLTFQLKEVYNDVAQIAGNLAKATGITKLYTTLNNALAKSFVAVGVGEGVAAAGARAFAAALVATGIGALIVLLGTAASALYAMATGEDEAAAASKRLNAQIDSQNRLIAANVDSTKRRNAEVIAAMKAAGKTEKEIRDVQLKQAYKDYSDAYDAQLAALKLFNANKATANEEDLKKLTDDLNARTKATKDFYSQYIVLGYNNIATDKKETEEAAKAKREKQKTNNDAALQIELDYQKRLRALKNENALLQIRDDFERSKEQLRQDYSEQVTELSQLKIKESQKSKIILEAYENYQLKLRNLIDKNAAELLKAEIDFEFKKKEILANAIEDEYDRQVQQRANQLAQSLTELYEDKEFIKLSEEEKRKLRRALQDVADRDIDNINKDRLLMTIDQYKKQSVIEDQFKTQELEGQIAHEQSLLAASRDFRDAWYEDNKIRTEEGYETLEERYQKEFDIIDEQLDGQLAQVKQAYDLQRITKEEYVAKSNELNQKKYDNDKLYTDRTIQLGLIELQAKRDIADAEVSIAQNVSNLLGAIAGKNFELQKAAAIAEAGVAIARIVIDTQRANIAFAASVAPLGPAGAVMAASYAVKSSIAAGLAIATILAQGIQKLQSINLAQSDANSGGSTGSGGGTQYADGKFRGYADGGLIGGKRHAQGGTMIEAEAGEAIMTRGAVTMFAPLLSMMNQAGGGTAFSPNAMVTSYDSPKSSNDTGVAPIIKTYVVSTDMTSSQEKNARLKDLSTI